jgi:hypothetical protein
MPNSSNSPDILAFVKNTEDNYPNHSSVEVEAGRHEDSHRKEDRRSNNWRAGDRRAGDRRRPENQGKWLGVERRRGDRRTGDRRTGDRRAANLFNAGRIVIATSFAATPFVAPLPGAPLKVAMADVLQPANDVTPFIQKIGNPFSEKAIYGRNVWDMQLFNGRIYMGHGDTSGNAGPIPICSYNPSSQSFTNEYTAPEEQIGPFRVIDGQLYTPGNDAREGWDLGSFYKLDPNGWVQKRTIPNALHVYDVAVHNGIMFAAIGTDSTTQVPKIMMSRDMGQTWTSASTESGRSYNFFQLGGEIYAVTYLSNLENPSWNNVVSRFDGTHFVDAPFNSSKMIPNTPIGTRLRMIRTAMLGSELLYVGAQIDNQSQWDGYALFAASTVDTARRVALPEATAKVYDVLVRNNMAYVLASVQQTNGKHTILVYSSQNASQWTELLRFTADTFARSFEELNGDFYFGLGSNVAAQSPVTGDIIRIARGVYSTAPVVLPLPTLIPVPNPVPTPVLTPTPKPTPVPTPTPVQVIVAAPTFQADGGVYDTAQEVVVSCETTNAAIHYTTSGNDPTESDPTIVSGRTVRVANSLILKAKAWGSAIASSDTSVKTVFMPSVVKTARYTINTKPADTSTPTINVLAPLQNQTYPALAAANGTAEDTGGSGLNAVYGRLMRYSDGYYWNGSAWTSQAVDMVCSGNASSWTCLFPPLADGRYGFIAKAQDRAGSTESSPLIILSIAAAPVVTPTPLPTPGPAPAPTPLPTPLPPVLTPPLMDAIAPTVSVRTPVYEATYKWLRSAVGKAKDIGGSRVQSVYGRLMRYSDNYYWNGTDWTAQAANVLCKGKTAWKLALPELADGQYAFTAIAQDGAGNLGSSPTIDFYIVAPAPRVGRRTVSSAFLIGNASVAQQAISLSFTEMLDANTIADGTNFLVEVNGVEVPIASLALTSSANTVVLQLNSDTLRPGNQVRVLWQDLLNGQDQPVPSGVWQGLSG